MDERARKLIEQGNHLFGKRSALLSLWQEISDNFYPERSGFTVSKSIGEDFAAHLTTSYPLLARRDLGNSFSAMLRPSAKEWFHVRASREEKEDVSAKRWLEWASGVQNRAMYDRVSQFTRATKEGDHDFAAFGQCVISVELNANKDALLYRCWHLADVAWCEGSDGRIDTVHRKWKPTARDLSKLFPGRLHKNVTDSLVKEPYKEFEVRHIVIPSGDYEYKTRHSFVSIYIDVENEHVIEEVGSPNLIYVIPRWQTVSGTQYAHSPATIVALPDARLIQSMSLALLEAGEKAANPPLVAVQEAIRSDLQVYAGGVTWVDSEYDERLGEVLRPITQDHRGAPVGMEMSASTVAMIKEAFFLNKLSMPPAGGPEMTAFEVGQRVQEYIRQAMPIFEPMEAEYNGALCETTFDLLMRNGAFGAAEDIPQSIRGDNVQFKFESPLREATERQKGNVFLEGKALLAQAIEIDPNIYTLVNARRTMRDVLDGIGFKAEWQNDEREVQAMDDAAAQQQQAVMALEATTAAAGAAEQIGNAATALQGTQV